MRSSVAVEVWLFGKLWRSLPVNSAWSTLVGLEVSRNLAHVDADCAVRSQSSPHAFLTQVRLTASQIITVPWVPFGWSLLIICCCGDTICWGWGVVRTPPFDKHKGLRFCDFGRDQKALRLEICS